MARFRLHEAHFFGSVRLRAGVAIADTQGNALPGDIVVTTLNSNTVTPNMLPLDAGGTAMRNASRYANVGVSATISGVSSIDA
jgi:hypothetical protein